MLKNLLEKSIKILVLYKIRNILRYYIYIHQKELGSTPMVTEEKTNRTDDGR